jgi:hypothetical protein
MRRSENFSAYWMGSIVAVAVSMFFCVVLAVRMFAYETLCRPDELCLREWVSALSGLLGVIVAFSSLAYVAKQVEQASRHHRDAMRVQLQRTRAVANRAKKSAQSVRSLGSHFVDTWMFSGTTWHQRRGGVWEFTEQVRRLSEALSDPVFEAFEQEIDLTGTIAVAQLKEALKPHANKSREQLFSFGSSMQPTDQDVHEARFIVSHTVRYAEERRHRPSFNRTVA